VKEIGEPIDFIKIDVEGATISVLDGAKETLAKLPPKRWVIEMQPNGPAVEFLLPTGTRQKVQIQQVITSTFCLLAFPQVTQLYLLINVQRLIDGMSPYLS